MWFREKSEEGRLEGTALWPGGAPPSRVLVAMSGGVDSSFTAWWLTEQGCEVIGLHFKMGDFLPAEDGVPRCCSQEEARDARRVADRLGFPFYVVSAEETFRAEVIEPFCQEYARGLTPNPCLFCNPRVKWRFLLQKARELGATAVATGHHARVLHEPTGARLLTGVDHKKDQSYFLYGLLPEQLQAAVLPAGWFHKNQVRKMLREAGFSFYSKPESQDLCFIGAGEYPQFVENFLGQAPPPGEIVDTQGRVLGWHPGLHHFTIGQRKGLNIAAAEPLYVISLDPLHNQVVVGTWSQTYQEEATIAELHWLSEPPGPQEKVRVKVRYKSSFAPAHVQLIGPDTARLRFEKPQRAIAPGQAAVIYRGAQVLGGGRFQAGFAWESKAPALATEKIVSQTGIRP